MTASAPPLLSDRGNRSFWTLVGLVVAFRGTLMLLACCVVCVVAVQVVARGIAVLWAGGAMLPAVVLAVLLVATAVTAGVRIARELHADRRLRREVRGRAVTPTWDLDRVAERSGLAGRLTVVADIEPYAFTHGFLVPRVVLSDALVDRLDWDELAAVLVHEAAHVRSRDPLKVAVTRLLIAREFYLPLLRHLARRFVAGRELAADRQAIARCGSRSLIAALLRTLGPPRWAAASASAMATTTTLNERIVQLETGDEPAAPPVPRALLAVSAVAAGLVLLTAADAALIVQQLCMRTM